MLSLIPQTRLRTVDFVAQNWGNIASVWGLALSAYVLWVAKGARAAAEEATQEAHQAAADAKAGEKVRTVLEYLQDAADKTREVRLLAGAKQWQLVQLRAEEVMNTCRIVVSRWGNATPLVEAKSDLLSAASQMESIIKEAGKPNASPKRVEEAQVIASNKLSSVVGIVLAEQDSRET